MATKNTLNKDLQLISSTTAQIELLKSKIDELEELIAPAKNKVMKYMSLTNTKKLENQGWVFTYTPKHTQKRLDTALLKENYEEVYNECLKENDVKATLRAKVDPKLYIENIKNK
jgi:hypothetical protein